MNRCSFIAASASAFALSAVVPARADDGSYAKVTRVAPVDDDAGGVLHDLEIEYAFPGRSVVWAGNVAAAERENAPLGTVAAAGVLRYLTAASYVVFRTAPGSDQGHPGNVLLTIDVSREYAKNFQANALSYDALPQPDQAVTLARIKYALGLDGDADSVLSDLLSPTRDKTLAWSADVRLLRGAARENLGRPADAETDYAWIVGHAQSYDAGIVDQARVAYARMLRARDDLAGAFAQYTAASDSHAVIFVFRQREVTTPGRYQRGAVRFLAGTAGNAREAQAVADANFGKLALSAQIQYRKSRRVNFSDNFAFDRGNPNGYHAVWEPMTFANKSPVLALNSNMAKFPPRFSMLDVQRYLKPHYFQDFESKTFSSDTPTSLASRWTKITVQELRNFDVQANLNIIQLSGGIIFDFSHRYTRIGTTTPIAVTDLMAEVAQPLCSAVSDFEEDIISALKCAE